MDAKNMLLLDDFIDKVGRHFVVPVFQRTYVWKKEQVQQLINDIENLIDNSDCHFVGSIIYVSDTRGNYQECMIIDGQQRLTTIFLILNQLKKIYIKLGDSRGFDRIENRYLNNEYAPDGFRLKLKPLVDAELIYKKIINDEFIMPEERKSLIYINNNYIEDYLTKNILIEKMFSVDDFFNALRKLEIVYIQLDESDNAQKIFESINSAGVKLEPSDLIRNYILMGENNNSQETMYYKYFKTIEKNISGNSISESDFYRFYLAYKKYNYISKKNLYVEFKKFYSDEVLTFSKENILSNLTLFSKFYNLIINGINELNMEIDQNIIDSLMMINNFDVLTVIPLLFEIMMRYYENRINKKILFDSLSLIESYLVRRNLVSAPSNSISRLSPSIVKKLNDVNYAENYYSSLVEFLVSNNVNNKNFMPNDSYVKNALKNINAYSNKHIKKILLEIENLNNDITINNVSIEHILPQKLNDYWREKVLKIENETVTESHERYLNMLGNLTILSQKDNSIASNSPFGIKKSVYVQNNHIKLNLDIISKESWDSTDIETRTNDMAKLILKRWKYPK